MRNRSTGRPEQYYGEAIRQPAFRIEIPLGEDTKEAEKKDSQGVDAVSIGIYLFSGTVSPPKWPALLMPWNIRHL